MSERERIGRLDINGNQIFVGDTVHCWDGKADQSEVTASLTGVVDAVVYSDAIQYEIDGNELALGCAEYIEIID